MERVTGGVWRATLSEAWPPADPGGGDHRRETLGGTRLVAAAALGGAARAVALARGGGPGPGWHVVPMVASVGDGDATAGAWRRAMPGDGVAAALVEALAAADGPGATLVPGDGFRVERLGDVGAAGATGPERAVGVDQTNESVVVGERLVVKWLLHPDPACERAPRLLRHLAAVGFGELPRPVGSLTWCDGAAVASPMTVALVDAWLPDARDGWAWCADAVVAHAAAGHACDGACPAGFPADLGAFVARLHVALASASAVIPAPVGEAERADVAAWAATARRTLEEAVALTTADDAAAGRELAAWSGSLADRLDPLDGVERTPVQPVHGDLHVGQVLSGPHGLAVIDFDGNPTADAAALAASAPAARDVAGMLCSLDHVGRVAIRRGAPQRTVDAWIAAARPAFLAAYRDGLAAAGRGALLDERLLEPFGVEQECRELIYAARFLPRWRHAPMGAIRAMVRG